MNEKVSVTWLGHSCFKLRWKGWSLIVDPYADGSVDGLPPLRESADAVYCSHGHGDHNGVQAVNVSGAPAPEGFSVETAVCPHDDAGGAKRGMNTIHIFSFGDLRVVHMGDVGCFPEEAILEKLRGCDLLLIPVGGYYTVDAREALAIVEAVSPRAVVPMHYRSDGQGFGYKVIAPVEEFLSLLPPEPVTRLVGPSFSLTDTLPVGTAVPHLEM